MPPKRFTSIASIVLVQPFLRPPWRLAVSHRSAIELCILQVKLALVAFHHFLTGISSIQTQFITLFPFLVRTSISHFDGKVKSGNAQDCPLRAVLDGSDDVSGARCVCCLYSKACGALVVFCHYPPLVRSFAHGCSILHVGANVKPGLCGFWFWRRLSPSTLPRTDWGKVLLSGTPGGSCSSMVRMIRPCPCIPILLCSS